VQRNNVLLPMALPTQSSLRQAVANIIRDIQRENGETDTDTADRLGVSSGTVANARNQKADLNALTIARIGRVYGAAALDPYNALYGATAQPVDPEHKDPLADLAHALSVLCDMRCAKSDGGVLDTPHEKLNALPALRQARASLDSYIAHAERLRAVA
jgi:transcriptional regulator with XRE-family HTH domain